MEKGLNFCKKIPIYLIKAYRYCLSPLLGNCCRFYPTCSAYAIEAIATHGVWRGFYLTLKRLARCQPFSAGGYHPVPGVRPTCPEK